MGPKMLEQLLEVARTIDAASLLLDSSNPPDPPERILQAVPDEVSLDQIKHLAVGIQDGSDTIAVLSAVYAALKSGKLGSQQHEQQPQQQIDRDRRDRVALEDIALQVGQVMEPVCSGATFDEDSTDYTSLLRNGLLALHILALLPTLAPQHDLVFPTKTLLSVIAFTNHDDPWASRPSAELARSLLASGHIANLPAVGPSHSPPPPRLRLMRGSGVQAEAGAETEASPTEKEKGKGRGKARFITEDVLTGFLRPLFAKSRPTTVTASGRPAAFPEPPPRYAQGDGFGGDDVALKKPWKYARRYAITVFEWAVDNADTDLLQQHWHLFTPILLTLLDEPQPASLKLRALSIFRSFWRLCPDGLLSRTGLADVFEQAVFPAVLSLPSLTPEAESLALLGAGYPALFDMVGLGGVDTSATTSEGGNKAKEGQGEGSNDLKTSSKHEAQAKGFTEAQRKLLDKIVREGIMVGYHHAKQHVRLVNFFCQTLSRLVGGMGILSVKYLKDIIPMISEILVDPFGTKHPPTLLSATRLLQAVLKMCWPRVPHYCNEIIKMAMVAWLNIDEDDDFPPGTPTKTELKHQLTRTVEILSAITEAVKLDMSDRVRPLVAKDPQLRPLFSSCEAK
ncbi:hypothetical protein GGR51DRAFT_475584 [Nemania sp. FL0031]|nr:hypothetical protein GGR51DRAFT_475584 [Nemania sp. FL0031]